MSWQPTIGKPFLVAMSFILSLVIWLVVQSENQDKEFSYDVPLDMARAKLSEGLVVVGNDKVPKVTLKGHGPAELVDKIKPEDLKPYVDLSKVGPITKSFVVKLERMAKDKEMGITWDPASTTLVIEQVRRRDLKVNVVTTGALRDGNLLFAGATVEPERVTVSGPESAFKQALIARVFLDLASVGNGNSQTKEVEILDGENREITGLEVEPKEVLLRPSLAAADQHRFLLVRASFQGTQPEFGYKVTNFSVTPAQVEFSGPSEALARLGTKMVDTKKIDLSGLTQSATFSVDLDLSGLRSLTPKQTTVRVRVQIDPITSVSQLNPQGP